MVLFIIIIVIIWPEFDVLGLDNSKQVLNYIPKNGFL